MLTLNRPLLRLAAAIHARIVRSHSSEPLLELPTSSWNRCCDLVRQSRRAMLRGWQFAALSRHTDLRYSIQLLQHELTAIVHRLTNSLAHQELATIRHIYADLIAIENDFESLAFDSKRCSVFVITEPITLKGVYLG